ncbi:MAG TPA: class I SAM-dependent methyltransferase [Burkholderiaceae bacterium]|nr:class I SAM-dependent methyltransferase [Burkholderiaceae bacterium]
MSHSAEVTQGLRFEFGKNWRRFLKVLDERRIALATDALAQTLGRRDLNGLSFLDAGSGSGLSSLAAWRLGARVVSFDYDPQSVACTQELRRRHAGGAGRWQVEEGSVLDTAYLSKLGKFDVVYSWGVLHHTGSMWKSLDNVARLVAPGGLLFISIYNDQGPTSRRWLMVKRLYNWLPPVLRGIYGVGVMALRDVRFLVGDLLKLQPMNYLRRWTGYAESSQRGMSRLHDWLDWVGGYPFEVAKPEEVFHFCAGRGFELVELRTCGGGLGCNEFVFRLSHSETGGGSQ